MKKIFFILAFILYTISVYCMDHTPGELWINQKCKSAGYPSTTTQISHDSFNSTLFGESHESIKKNDACLQFYAKQTITKPIPLRSIEKLWLILYENKLTKTSKKEFVIGLQTPGTVIEFEGIFSHATAKNLMTNVKWNEVACKDFTWKLISRTSGSSFENDCEEQINKFECNGPCFVESFKNTKQLERNTRFLLEHKIIIIKEINENKQSIVHGSKSYNFDKEREKEKAIFFKHTNLYTTLINRQLTGKKL